MTRVFNKRLFWGLLVVLLGLLAFVNVANAEPEGFIDKTGKWYYYLEDSQATVVSSRGNELSGKVTLPKKVDKYPVVGYGRGLFYDKQEVTSVTIPEGVTTLGFGVFYGCEKLTSVSLPASLTSITGNPFIKCPAVTVKIAPKNKVFEFVDGILWDKEQKALVSHPAAIAMTGEYVVPEGTLLIGGGALYDCEELTSIVLPDSLTGIGADAFNGCYGLTELNLPKGLTAIGHSAFSSCYQVSAITLPASLTSMTGNPFYWGPPVAIAPGNTVFELIDGVLYDHREKAVVSCSPAKTGAVVIPEGTLRINDSAFSDCKAITGVTIPASVARIGDRAFYNSGITGVVSLEGVESISEYAFSDCKSLTGVTFSAKLKSIGDGAFSRSGLTSITIPGSLTNIGGWIFSDCESLASATIEEGITVLGHTMFTGCISLTDVNIPASLTSIGDALAHSGITALVIPDGVTSIDSYQFSECLSLTSVTIPKTIESLGPWAFSGCDNLASLTIQGTELTIGDYSFRELPSLTTVVIGEGVKSIGREAFGDCARLSDVTFLEGATTSIGKLAFSNCWRLKNITIPQGVTKIDPKAFHYTPDSGLTIHVVEGSKAEKTIKGIKGMFQIKHYDPAEQTAQLATAIPAAPPKAEDFLGYWVMTDQLGAIGANLQFSENGEVTLRDAKGSWALSKTGATVKFDEDPVDIQYSPDDDSISFVGEGTLFVLKRPINIATARTDVTLADFAGDWVMTRVQYGQPPAQSTTASLADKLAFVIAEGKIALTHSAGSKVRRHSYDAVLDGNELVYTQDNGFENRMVLLEDGTIVIAYTNFENDAAVRTTGTEKILMLLERAQE